MHCRVVRVFLTVELEYDAVTGRREASRNQDDQVIPAVGTDGTDKDRCSGEADRRDELIADSVVLKDHTFAATRTAHFGSEHMRQDFGLAVAIKIHSM